MAEFCKGISEKHPAYDLIDGRPQPKRSVVSFVDILGYSEKVSKAANEDNTESFLYEHRQLLFAASEYIFDTSPKYAFNYTDTVVIGWPIMADSEVPLCISGWELAKYQLTMTLGGYFIRGGIAIGDAYFDKYVQSGEAYIEAYDVEENVAINPRIVLTEDAVKEAKHACGSYSSDAHCPINDLLHVDSDGLVFINYLAALFDIYDPDYCWQDIENDVLAHKKIIEENLVAYRQQERIYRKYQWAARYHDGFCERTRQLSERRFLIGIEYGKERIARSRPLLEVFPDWTGAERPASNTHLAL